MKTKNEKIVEKEENSRKRGKIIPRQIIIPVCYSQDEETGEVYYDFENMAFEFKSSLSNLDDSVTCSVEIITN
tara:strand:- start:675 stop:893 length:219 start_codon:yes stop_codon:yes gene_type:complete